MKVQSLERAFNIIELLGEKPSGMILSDIAAALSLPISTVYRLITDLGERGYVSKEPMTNTYKIGLRFIDIASQYLSNLELKTEAHPYLAELCFQVNHSVFLATMQDDEVCYIDRIDPYATNRGYSIIGQRRSLFSTSLGKALLLDRKDDEILDLIKKKGITRYTPYTIIEPRELLRKIHECKEKGWVSDNQEDRLDFQCVGVPVYDYRKKIVASISCSWDKTHFGSVNVDQIASAVKTAAEKISHRLGFINSPE